MIYMEQKLTIQTNKILTNLNHGFRSGYSCESQLLITINDFLKEHDKDHQVDEYAGYVGISPVFW
jgi:hypothetical protein